MTRRNDVAGLVQIARRSAFRLRVLAVIAALVASVGVSLALVLDTDVEWAIVGALALLFVVAENRDRVFADETSLSGSIAVALAACMYFAATDSIIWSFVICLTGGIYVPHIRQRAWSKILLNSACFASSALVASAVAWLVIPAGAMAGWVVLAVPACAVAYWTANCVVLGLAVGWCSGRAVRHEILTLLRSDTVLLVFGLGGALCGIVMVEVGVWVGIGTLVALLVALDVFVISVPAGLVSLRAAWVMLLTRGVSGGVAGTVSAVVTRAVSVSVLSAIAGIAAGVVAGAAVVAAFVAIRLYLRFGRADSASVGGVVIVELVVPVIAATAGAVAAAANLTAGLAVASGLVVAVSLAVALRRHREARRPKVADDDVLLAAVVEAMMDGLPARDR